jgi:hypothetical protein
MLWVKNMRNNRAPKSFAVHLYRIITVFGLLFLGSNAFAASYAGSYTGTYSGPDSGTWAVAISSDGAITGTSKSSFDGSVDTVSGQVSSSGSVAFASGSSSTGSTFTGTIDPITGAMSGTWFDSYFGVSGSFSGQRVGGSPSTLSVTKSGTGSGTVTSSPAGINCGATCSASVTSGTSVTLAASAAAGSTFAGWGGACSGTGICTVTMDAAKAVSATFNAAPFALTVTGVSNGLITAPIATVTTRIGFSADTGKSGAVFVTASVPAGSLGALKSAAVSLQAAPRELAGSSSFVLVQLTNSGWQQVVNGQLLPYSQGVLGDQLAAQTILNNTDTTGLKGAQFCLGYGTGATGSASAADMIASGRAQLVGTIPTDASSAGTDTGTCLVNASTVSGAAVSQFASRATLSSSTTVYGAFALVNPTYLYIAVRGPSLAGISPNPHPHPSLNLYSGSGTLLASSSQCTGSDANSAAVLSYYQNRGAPLSVNDPCLGYVSSSLPAGVYTFQIVPDTSTPTASGEVLFETVPTGTTGASLAQFASRATLTPSGTVYGAFALVNPSSLYIAVRGPSLGTLGVSANPHTHPKLNLFNASGTPLVSSNLCNGTSSDQLAVLSYYQSRGAPLTANDPCLGYVSTTLPAGVYTFQVVPDASAASNSGEVLFETTPIR